MINSDYYFLSPTQWEDELQQLQPPLQDVEKPVVVFIGGPTGSGKSSTSIILADLLGIRNYISTDTIRLLLSMQDNQDPILNYFSHECWKWAGKYTEKNLVDGFKMQAEQIKPSLKGLLDSAQRHHMNTVIEGIHLLPSVVEGLRPLYPQLHIAVLYLSTSFEFFKDVLLPRRVVSTYRHRSIERYEERMETFQSFLKMWEEEYKIYGVDFIVNDAGAVDLIKKALNSLVRQLS